jgi:hypothetical protein
MLAQAMLRVNVRLKAYGAGGKLSATRCIRSRQNYTAIPAWFPVSPILRFYIFPHPKNTPFNAFKSRSNSPRINFPYFHQGLF